MNAVSKSLCLNHPLREAAARCVGCGKSFCRECVTALDRRMFCSGCLIAQSADKVRPKRDWFLLTTGFQLVLAALVLWAGAYYLGKLLLSVPSEFHEGKVWEKVLED
jgi:hypothetical protein